MLKTVGDKVSPTVQIALFFCVCCCAVFLCFYFLLCGSRKYPYPPRRVTEFPRGRRDKFPKGRGVHKKFFFPEGLKCDQINTYVFFPIDSGNQERGNRRRIPCDIFSIIILAPDNTYSTEAHL